jgi:methylated-DNA-[protein]-cysteine S-methyltransferase
MDRIVIETPIGGVGVVARDGRIARIELRAPPPARGRGPGAGKGVLGEAQRQLEEYFAGRRRTFDLPLAIEGTPFQREVWTALGRIPYGQTTSYAAIAADLGRPDAFRAVGAANGRNPFAIVLPCHRVIGADGSLTGYAGGLSAKRFLLDLEARVALERAA